jgi:hypothetical protein
VNLEEAVASFSKELEYLLRSIFGRPIALIADWQQAKNVWRVSISTADVSGMQLSIKGQPVFQLQLWYLCEYQSSRSRLTIRKSSFKVMHAASRMPLWHYDYVRDMKKAASAIAHLNVYAHRNEIVGAMAAANRRPEELQLQAIHFPFGGPRYRPTIEDVFEMLITEFDIDVDEGALKAIRKSRILYFKRQLEGAVFDAPQIAAAVLRDLGFKVDSPSLL